MRKPVLIAVLVVCALCMCCGVAAQASEVLGMSYFVELGYAPNGGFVMYNESKVKDRALVDYDLYADLDVNLWVFNTLYVGGNVRTDFWKSVEGYDFIPNKMTYGIKAGIDLKNLEIGFRHYCIHPIYVYMTQTEFENNYDPLWEGSYEEVFVRFKGGIGGTRSRPR
jgi:hypothetical protein